MTASPSLDLATTMERHIDCLTNLITLEKRPTLKPLHAVDPEQPIDEVLAQGLQGHRTHSMAGLTVSAMRLSRGWGAAG